MEMERVVPGQALVAADGAVRTRRPDADARRSAVETMLRIHFMQQWFTLSDPAMEEALHDMPLYREFAGLGGWSDRLPDETTILRFRHLLEKHKLATEMLATVNELLRHKGLMLRAGTVVDATLDRRADFDQEHQGSERDPRDAPDQEGQPVVLRHEGPHRGGCRLGLGAHGAGHLRQRQRRGRGQRTAARPGDRCLRRCRLPGRGQAPGRQAQGALARGDAPGQARPR